MIKFEISGSLKGLEKAIIESVKKQILKSVGSARCPVHNESPRIKIQGTSLKNLSFEVNGCCDDLKKKVTEKIGK